MLDEYEQVPCPDGIEGCLVMHMKKKGETMNALYPIQIEKMDNGYLITRQGEATTSGIRNKIAMIAKNKEEALSIIEENI